MNGHIGHNGHIVLNGQLFKCDFYDGQESKYSEKLCCINREFYLVYHRFAFIELMRLLTSVPCLQVFLQEQELCMCALLIVKMFTF